MIGPAPLYPLRMRREPAPTSRHFMDPTVWMELKLVEAVISIGAANPHHGPRRRGFDEGPFLKGICRQSSPARVLLGQVDPPEALVIFGEGGWRRRGPLDYSCFRDRGLGRRGRNYNKGEESEKHESHDDPPGAHIPK